MFVSSRFIHCKRLSQSAANFVIRSVVAADILYIALPSNTVGSHWFSSKVFDNCLSGYRYDSC
ncbi:hypothetical protein [Bacillus glycinifermentans]|uniref:Uncharacterized protein n=1 Tax=Bacillus glycinifermentans TaxID=1664069 RepID=A0ABU6H035_9BACI|nr:hypothetical protein [Bacillus glycinifermentans]MEC0484380.1 hypothetical protein [Bacillus glycinifermentans]MEC0496772.1 hypothetical protein [Bacillus glycinifermentans]UOY87802.1 hypothetical protein MW696_17290 [Bacillus glycinifermentans]